MFAKARGRPWGRWALCTVLFGAGAWGLATTMGMSFASGKSMAHTDLGHWIQPSAVLVVDLMVACLAAVVFTLFAKKTAASIFAGFLMALILTPFAFYSVKNSISYSMTERVEKAAVAETNSSADLNAVKATNQNALGLQERKLSWLRAEHALARREGRKADMIRFEDKIEAASKAPVESKAETVDVVAGDPDAKAWAELLGVSEARYVMINQAALAILLILAKVFGFGLSTAMWPRRPDEAVAPPASIPAPVPAPVAAPVTVSHVVPAEIVPVADVPVSNVPPLAKEIVQLKAVTKEHLTLVAPSLESLEGPEKRSTISRESLELENERRNEGVREFLATEVVTVNDLAQTTRADDIYQQYVGWAPRNGFPYMTNNAFGAICTDRKVRKEKRSGYIRYFLRSAQEVPALKLAA